MIRIILPPLLTFLVSWGFSTNTPDQEPSHTSTNYPEHLTGTFTGGFGEDTCHSCHFDYPLNPEEGTLRVEGIPEEYESGQSYMIHIYLERPDLVKAGFQLTARFSDGRQAGMFSPQSDRTQFTEQAPDSIQYLQHSGKGTKLTGEESNEWHFKWIAPVESGEVQIHLAANAANGDASEFGDFILTREFRVTPVE